MYICLCQVVTRATIEAAIQNGATTVEAVGQGCGAGTDCGKCQRSIMRLLELREQQAGSTYARSRPNHGPG
jgi:bacterioferritin-associated ferredoxin